MKEQTYDAVVYGDGASAFAAALRFIEKKHSVLLVMSGGSPLSEITMSFLQDMPKGISAGADKFIMEMRQAGVWKDGHVDPATALIKTLEMLQKAAILFYARPAGAVRTEDALKAVIFAAKSGLIPIRAKAFVDASNDLEMLNCIQPELRSMPDCDSVMTFEMELDEDIQPGAFSGGPDISAAQTVWENGRLFQVRNGQRLNLPAILEDLREQHPEYRDAIVTRASLGNAPLCAAVMAADSPYKNFFAAREKASFTFAHHREMVSARMLEGEKIADDVCRVMRYLEIYPVDQSEIMVQSCPQEVTADVLVCGGGTAGAVAAIAAARSGVSVTLWEASSSLGGIGTVGSIPVYYYGLSGGLQNEVDARTKECSEILCGRHIIPDNQQFRRFHPLAKMIVLEQMCKMSGVKIEYNRMIYGAVTSQMEAPRFPVVRSAVQPKMMNKLEAVEAATPDGLVRCAAKTFIDSTGDADVAVFAGARYTEGRETDGIQHIYSIPAYCLSPMVEKNEKGDEIRSYCMIMPYNVDAGYVDATDPWDISRARRIGLLGYQREKYQAYGHVRAFSTVVGVRASRQIEGDTRLGLADQIRASEFPDVIAYSASHYDNHARDFENESHTALLWSRALDGHFEPIGCEIPYRVMLPLGVENLIVACRSLSLDFDASQQFRMQRDMQRIGEAAGDAAAIAVADKVLPRYINVGKLQNRLFATSALLEPESNYHCDQWKPAGFYPERRVFELSEHGFSPSRELLPGGVNGFIQLNSDLKSADLPTKYGAAVKLAAGANSAAGEKLLVECIQSRCAEFPAEWKNKSMPLWKAAIAICGENKLEGARKVLEDVLTDEQCVKDQQALILAVRALGKIGDEQSAKAINLLLQRGDVAHIQEFPYWMSEQTLVDDSRWKLDLAGFEAMYNLGLKKPGYLNKYSDDPRGYVRKAAAVVKARTIGKK